MKLQVNSEHKKCSYNSKGRKIFIKLGSIFCGVSLFSGAITSAIQYKLSEETLIPVTEDARNSIYQDVGNEYFKSLNSSTKNNIDYNITDRNIDNIKSLNIDMRNNDNLKFISNFSNLNKIKILNAQMLSDADIIILCNLQNLNDIEFDINIDDMIKNNKVLPDLGYLKSKKVTIKSITELKNEVDEFKYYNYISRYLSFVECGDIDCDKYFQIDNKLNDIMSKLNINEYSSSEERVMKIVFSIIDFLNYDDEIDADLKNSDYNSKNISKVSSNRSKYYSGHLLSAPLINDDYYTKGICVNYSAIFEAVCAKLGIEAHSVGGITYDNIDVKHEWNYVKIDNEYVLIDLNAIDNSCSEKNNIYNEYFNKYMKDQKNGIDNKEVMNIFIESVFEDYSDYMDKNYFSYDNDEKILAPFDDTRSVKYYNNSSDNKMHDVDYILSTLVGSISGMAVVIPASLLMLKKRIR